MNVDVAIYADGGFLKRDMSFPCSGFRKRKVAVKCPCIFRLKVFETILGLYD